jgi:uncharacterized protein (TIGR02145 family)
LIAAAGGSSAAGKNLKSRSGWERAGSNMFNGDDKYGFKGLPNSNGHDMGYWWSSTQAAGNTGKTAAGFLNLVSNNDVTRGANGGKINPWGVRCLKN